MTNEERFKESVRAKAEKFKGTVQLIGPAKRYKAIIDDAEILSKTLMGGAYTDEDDVYDNTSRNKMCVVHFCNIVFLDSEETKAVFERMAQNADEVVMTAANGCPRVSFIVNDVWQ